MIKLLRFPIAALAALLFSGFAHAQLRVDVKTGTVEPVPIAVPEFAPVADIETPTGQLSDIGASISQVIVSNLVSTGLFRAVDENAFIEKITAAPTRPNFASWRPLAVQGLVTGKLEIHRYIKEFVNFCQRHVTDIYKAH